jgi:hypothetical protein
LRKTKTAKNQLLSSDSYAIKTSQMSGCGLRVRRRASDPEPAPPGYAGSSPVTRSISIQRRIPQSRNSHDAGAIMLIAAKYLISAFEKFGSIKMIEPVFISKFG